MRWKTETRDRGDRYPQDIPVVHDVLALPGLAVTELREITWRSSGEIRQQRLHGDPVDRQNVAWGYAANVEGCQEARRHSDRCRKRRRPTSVWAIGKGDRRGRVGIDPDVGGQLVECLRSLSVRDELVEIEFSQILRLLRSLRLLYDLEYGQ